MEEIEWIREFIEFNTEFKQILKHTTKPNPNNSKPDCQVCKEILINKESWKT